MDASCIVVVVVLVMDGLHALVSELDCLNSWGPVTVSDIDGGDAKGVE